MRDTEIVIRFKGELRKIKIQEIVLIEQNLRKVFFYLNSEVYTTYGKISDYEENLPRQFYRCNKSYLINLDKVISMKNQVIYFSDGIDIRLGRKSFTDTKKAFLAFVLEIECGLKY